MGLLRDLNKIICLAAVVSLFGLTGCLQGGGNGHTQLPVVKPSGGGGVGQNVVAYESVRHILIQYCVDCHNKMGQRDWSKKDVALAGKKDGSLLKRIWKLIGTPKEMPLAGSAEAREMSEDDRVKLKEWLEASETASPGKQGASGDKGGSGDPGDDSGSGSSGDKSGKDNGTVSRFQKVESCFGCHGDNGISKQSLFPHLAGQTRGYLFNQLKAFKSGQRKSAMMSGVAAGLEEADMEFVAQYFSQINPEQVMAIQEYSEEQLELVAKGKEISQSPSITCNGCHIGDRSRSTNPEVFPNLAGQWPEVLELEIEKFASGERPGQFIMAGILRDAFDNQEAWENATEEEQTKMDEQGLARLSKEDIRALVLYYSTLVPGEPIEVWTSRENTKTEQGTSSPKSIDSPIEESGDQGDQ